LSHFFNNKYLSLQALINYQNAEMQAQIANEKEQQLDTLLNLVAKRQQSGDVSQVDAELTFLSLSQTLNTTAQAQVLLANAKAKVVELLPDWTSDKNVIPAQGIAIEQYKTNTLTSEQWLNQHPLVQIAKLQWQISKSDATQALLATKSDPTLGINAGKTDGDNALGLNFSMPLYVRNNFSSEARAANQQAIAAQSQLHAVLRKQKFAMQAATESVLAYKNHYQRWKKLMQGRDKRIAYLLQKQWQSGDMSTSKYLLALQQRADGLLAGIELQSQFKRSQINWLLAIGQIDIALKSLNRS
jgi:outer membrane protein TolC